MIYFTADTHFGHANVLKFAERPYQTIEQMNAALIAAINARVMPNDELWILGDFSFKLTVEQAQALRKRIRCANVHLIPGNHDKDWSQPAVTGTFLVEPPIAVLKAEGRKLVLSHYPMMDWQSLGHGSIHLHGHIHSLGPAYNEWNRAEGLYRYDVGVDANGYAPVSLAEVLAFFDGVEHRRRVGGSQWTEFSLAQTACPHASDA